MDIAKFVEDTRNRVVAEADGDDYDDYVDEQATPATRIAFGLVALGEISEAKKWFDELGSLWVEGADFAIKFRLEKKKRHTSVLPANKWFRALASAVMSGDQPVWHETARDVHDQITAPEIQELDGIERAGRLSSYAALSGLGADATIQPLIEKIRQRATKESESEVTYAWDGIEFNGPQADILAAIDKTDPSAVTEGINGLLEFHEEYRVDNHDIHELEREIDFHSTMYVVLARQERLDIRVDGEYVPAAIYDDGHYQVSD